jgi:predicted DCC family thiol-disulfide oxidoreductase YuxK
MSDSSAQGPLLTKGAHLVIYDGVCGLCSRLLQFLVEHDRHKVFAFASLQSAVGRAVVERTGGNPDELSSFLVLANYRANHPELLSRSRAALFVAGQLGWPWKMAVLMRALPVALRDRLYSVVARNRYRVLGRVDQCSTLRPEFRGRSIE